jgi:tRNA(Ile)-lysidine synthase
VPEPSGLSAAEFATRLDPLGPFGAIVAVAVSGGADSMALALLTRDFVAARGLAMLALIVDHGLRAESAAEAALAARRLAAIGIDARLLRVEGLSAGPGLAERARTARYDILARACGAAGIVHLLLGHHARDQAETVMMRAAAGSGPAGLAGMAAWRAGGDFSLLRPLLGVPPGRLRARIRRTPTGARCGPGCGPNWRTAKATGRRLRACWYRGARRRRRGRRCSAGWPPSWPSG